MKTFGSRLKDLRNAKGLTQEQLALELGVTHSSVSKWERDNGKPDFNSLVGLRELLDVSLDDLVFGAKPDTDQSRAANSNETTLLRRFRTASAKKRTAVLNLLEE